MRHYNSDTYRLAWIEGVIGYFGGAQVGSKIEENQLECTPRKDE